MDYKVVRGFTSDKKAFKLGESVTRESVGTEFANKVNDGSLEADNAQLPLEDYKSEPTPNAPFKPKRLP